jgi:uncharacterized damage-inducible protein DinB
MIETSILSQLIHDAFSGKITWLEAASRYPVEDFIASFKRTLETMIKTIDGLTDAQVAHIVPGNPMWSISEMVTHLIYSQNSYYNMILVLAPNTGLPHIAEAARGFGEGAKRYVAADELRENLKNATETIVAGFEKTLDTQNPTVLRDSGLFGPVNYAASILLLLGHEMDHVRQAVLMRRAARAAFPSEVKSEAKHDAKPDQPSTKPTPSTKP